MATRRGPIVPGTGAPRDAGEAQLVHLWVRRDLSARFDAALHERLPQDLLQLVEQLD